MADTGLGPRRAMALVDGEHYPDVVRAALAELPYDVVCAVLVGGTEKLRGEPDFGVPLAASVEDAAMRYQPDLALDLSDEPVLGPVERFALASRVLALGIPIEGADFRFDPPRLTPVSLPTLAVTGTGKRIGKTAITGFVVRQLCDRRSVVVVAMGRGGPAEPEVIEARPTLETLLALSRAGRHAASDHLETAALTGVPTVGCRRCGGGLAGAVGISNVLAGFRLAETLAPDLVVLDGSGAAIPPIAADKTLLVVGAHQDPRVATGYLNAFRIIRSDAIVVSMADAGDSLELSRALRDLARPDAPVVRVVLRPRPIEPIAGERVAYFGTAPVGAHPAIAAHLEERHDARVASVSGALGNRERLAVELGSLEADTVLVELKAAAVDVVIEAAVARGLRVVLAANDVVALPGEPDLGEVVDELATGSLARMAVE